MSAETVHCGQCQVYGGLPQGTVQGDPNEWYDVAPVGHVTVMEPCMVAGLRNR